MGGVEEEFMGAWGSHFAHHEAMERSLGLGLPQDMSHEADFEKAFAEQLKAMEAQYPDLAATGALAPMPKFDEVSSDGWMKRYTIQ